MTNTNKGKLILLSKFPVCDSKKLGFINKQEACGFLSRLGLKASLSKIPQLGDVLFQRYEMNEIVNMFLAGDIFTPEIHLKRPRFRYIAC